jgi:hypothetical protein
VLWMSMAVMMSTAWMTSMPDGMRAYACMRASSSARRELSSPKRMEKFPPEVMLRCEGSIHTPNVEEGVFVFAPRTEPSEALYRGYVSDRSKRRDNWSDVREGSEGCV